MGMTGTPADKDSIRAYNIAKNRYLIAAGMDQLKASGLMQAAAWKVNMDSIRKIYPKARMDSVNNGADEEYSWQIAFGLLVGLVWLYLEILRLLSKTRSRR